MEIVIFYVIIKTSIMNLHLSYGNWLDFPLK